jgi:hypothetical protein
MKNEKKLKVGEHTLNESLSSILYQEVSEWYFDDFGEEISFERCQRILTQLGFKISWMTYENKETGSISTSFSVAIESEEIEKILFSQIPYISFDLPGMSSDVPSTDDFA